MADYTLALICDNLTFLRYELSDGKGKKPKPMTRPQPRRKSKLDGIASERVNSLLFDRRR